MEILYNNDITEGAVAKQGAVAEQEFTAKQGAVAEQGAIKRGVSIAIDGYSSCGKSTFAKAIAARLGYIFIDTGSMYRVATYLALREGLIVEDELDSEAVGALLRGHKISFQFNAERGASDATLDGEVIEGSILRSMEVASRVSRVAAIGAVREQLVEAQQALGRDGGVVMDGRDIGTVVMPNAEVKIFMTADPMVRAHRRYDELKAKGEEVALEVIVENVVQRDREDEQREISPLRRAEDAVLLDNSYMSVEQQMGWFEELYRERVGR
ncbi:MAG: (d)CMP kinase [Rikenellaceae bacterium]